MKLMASWEGHTFSVSPGFPSNTGIPFFRAKAMSSAKVRSAFGGYPPEHLLCTLFLTAKRTDNMSRYFLHTMYLTNSGKTYHSARCSCILF